MGSSFIKLNMFIFFVFMLEKFRFYMVFWERGREGDGGFRFFFRVSLEKGGELF